MAHPRNLIVVGSGAEATLVETYMGLGDGAYFNNSVTEVVVGENAGLAHYRVQDEGSDALHVSTLQVKLEQDARYDSHVISMGGGLTRNDLAVLMESEGAQCRLNGLYIADG